MKYIKNNKKEVVITIGIIVLTIFLVFAFRSGEIQNLKTGSRLHVWVKSIQLTNEHPIMGYGIGTFKHLFHPLSGMKTVAFRTAHNFFVQILFETGYSGLLFILSMLSYLFYKLIKTKSILCLVGLSMLVADGLVHFPDRMIQAILLIVMFLAYCTVKIKERSDGRTE